MLTSPPIFDMINLSVRSADFLCQDRPLVCAVELNRSSDRRRTRAFLLEGDMKLKHNLNSFWATALAIFICLAASGILLFLVNISECLI